MKNKILIGNFIVDFQQEDPDLFSVQVSDCSAGHKKVDPAFYFGETIGSSVAVTLKQLTKILENVRVLNSIDYKLKG